MRLACIYAPIYTPWRKAHGGEGNRRTGEFLKELDLTEGRSPGIPKILKVMQENGSPAIEFETDEERTFFLFRLLVDAIGEQGLKPTAKGNLPRALCREAALAYWG